MKIKHFIPFETPSKKNSRITLKNGRTIPSVRYREWHDAVCLTLNANVKQMIESKCYIILLFTHGDLRRRDADNGTSSIFDTLQDVKQIIDDNWQIVKSHHVFNDYKKNTPSCEIRIYTPEEKQSYLKDLLEYAEKYD